MTEVKFRRSRAHLCAAFGYVGLVAIPIPLLVCWDVMEWGTGRQVVKWDTLGAAVFSGALMLCLGGLLLWILLNHLSTKLTPEGVGQRGFAGWKFIPWHEVTDVRQISYDLQICGGRRKVNIPSWAYSDWDEVARFIAEHLPPRLTVERRQKFTSRDASR